MTHVVPLVFVLPAALWAALLALAEGSLASNPKLGVEALPPVYAEKPERLRRGLAIGRITLLALCAVALSGAVHWWDDPLFEAFGWLVLLVGGTVLAADLVPRAIGLWKGGVLGRSAVRLAVATLTVPAPVFVAAGILDRAFARLFGIAQTGPRVRELAQREMMLGVFALADTMVSEVMTPRVDIVAVDVHASLDEVVKQVAAAEHARLPVYDGDIDHIVGVLYTKDLMPGRFGNGEAKEWQTLLRPAGIVPEVKTLDRQLRDFQRGVGHLALVVDEYGGTAGIVTLEDVLEEIVGEIGDEYDEALGPPVVETAPGVFQVDGRAPLDQLAIALGVPLEHQEVSTAGGFVYAALGHVPAAGETVEIAGCRITVEKVAKRSIEKLRFERLAPPEPAGADGKPA
ncbi:MAG: hemolysin family protein [Gemmatimonadales bacterium]